MEGHGAYYTNLMNEGTYNKNYEDILDTPTEFQQTPPIKDNNPSSKATRKQKGENFTEEEDRLLVSAWLNVSTDATQGTNQKYCTFWKRIYMFYETNKGDIAERSQNSLMHRWNVIQEIVSRFCGALSQIENRNQSGQTIYDKVEQAEQLFKTNDPNNKSFQLRHCWLKLKDQPKWHIRHNELAAARTSNKKQKTRKNSSPGILDLTTEDGNEVLPAETIFTNSDAPKRPIGKKKAKESLRGGGSDVCKEALDILWAKKREDDAEKERKREERYAKSYALEKERLELDKEKHALEKERVEHENNNSYLKKIAEEERIMGMNLSCMNELQRQFYMSLQTEILAKRCS